MTEKKYKLLSAFYILSTILFMVFLFLAIFSIDGSDGVRAITIIYAVVALLLITYFIGFLIWSFKNEVGREYWVFYFDKMSYKFPMNTLYYTEEGQHPADKMKKMLIWFSIMIAVVVGFTTFMDAFYG